MPFFAAQNLTLLTVQPCEPWTFKPTESITAQIRGDKISRQEWYRNQTTHHCFYTGLEGVNPHQRISKDNPIKFAYAAVGDFDAKIPDERVLEAIKAMPIKPTWWERSLNGQLRLVWIFERPVPIESDEFFQAFQTELRKLLCVEMLPALDAGAWTSSSRLYCVGDAWNNTGADPVPFRYLQTTLIKVAEKFKFRVSTEMQVPFEVVLPRIKELYPGFSWPVEFKPETQGPTFWIPESASPLSAIVKLDGMFTFSAHASKTFYNWGDILGAEWVREYKTKSLAKATDNVYWHSERGVFYMARDWSSGRFVVCKEKEVEGYLRGCGLSTKPGPGGSLSEVQIATNYIQSKQGCDGLAPFLYNPHKLVEYDGKRYVNEQHQLKVMQPSKERGVWGPNGNFPYLSAIFDHLLSPRSQMGALQAWMRYTYKHCYEMRPVPGQVLILCGLSGTGKTLISQRVFGTILGGHKDPSQMLTGRSIFGSELYHSGCWCSDDTPIEASQAGMDMFQAMIKRAVANQIHIYHKKHSIPHPIEWMGRLILTLNIDFHSIANIPPMDNSTEEKISIFRCSVEEAEKFKEFLPREEGSKILDQELPCYCNWLLNTEIDPEYYSSETRYGLKPHHEESIIQQSRFATRASTTGETIKLILDQYWDLYPGAAEWRCMTADMLVFASKNPDNHILLRNAKAELWGRDIETLRRTKQIVCEAKFTLNGRKLWLFKRPADTPLKEAPSTPETGGSKFSNSVDFRTA